MAKFGFDTTGEEIVEAFKEQVKGRTFLITGASYGGIGAQTAVTLALGLPAHILLLARDPSKVEQVVKTIGTRSPHTNVEVVTVSLNSLKSVQSASDKILNDDSTQKIDVVINNAGIMAAPYSKTEDGYESQFAISYLSHFLLTKQLMPKILASGSLKRIVNVSSYGNIFSDVLADPGFAEGKEYDSFKAYGQSQTANVLMAVGINERYGAQGVKAFALNPGGVPSNLRRFMDEDSMKSGMALHKAHGITPPARKTPEQGCSTVLKAALDPNLPSDKGIFLDNCDLTYDEKIVSKHSQDKRNAQRVWEMSEIMVAT